MPDRKQAAHRGLCDLAAQLEKVELERYRDVSNRGAPSEAAYLTKSLRSGT
jgi:hypothetical protein